MIHAEHLSFTYEGSARPSLDDVSLHIRPGEFVAILGHNGCGKSTLAKHLNALLPLQSGKLTVAGIDVSRESEIWKLRQKVGMVFQNPDNQFVSTIVSEDVAFGLENYALSEAEIPQKVSEALAAVGMAGFEKRSTHMLSGGQKQRIAIARIFLKNPPILILDEATSALDTLTESKIQHAFDELAKNRTTLIIAHRLSTIRAAGEIVVIADGRIAERGSHAQLLQQNGLYAALCRTQNLLG